MSMRSHSPIHGVGRPVAAGRLPDALWVAFRRSHCTSMLEAAQMSRFHDTCYIAFAVPNQIGGELKLARALPGDKVDKLSKI